jgi:transcriptional regulator with XRE-family HTH domain
MRVDDVAALTPDELREMRTLLGWTFTDLSKRTGISRAQLCEYSTGVGNLRRDQIERCAAVLRKALSAHSQRISAIVGEVAREAVSA